MIEGFPCHRQPTANSCLPTSVYAVLEHLGYANLSLDTVAKWCRSMSGGGSLWDFALDGLRQQFDIEDLEGDWEAIQEALVVNEEPVIATIAHPLLNTERTGDHAIVLVGIEEEDDGIEYIHFMDPMTGNIERKATPEFLRWWDKPGQRAFTLRV